MQPFRFWQWTRLALVGLLAGEMGSGGSFKFPTSFNFPRQSGPSSHLLEQGFPKIDPAILGGLIAVLVVAGLVFLIVMTYISSVMRFILFDSVLAKECHIRRGVESQARSGVEIFFVAVGTAGGDPCGVWSCCSESLLVSLSRWDGSVRLANICSALILGGIVVFFVGMALVVALAVVHVMTKDFVVPQMALEGIGAMEGWRRLWPMIQAEKGGYAGYVGMKIVLAIAAGIIIGIASVILALFVAIPT